MARIKEKRSGKDRREKDNQSAETYIKYFIPEKEERRTKGERRKSTKNNSKKGKK